MDDLERELDNDTSSEKITFLGTGSPGRPSNAHMFYEAPRKSITKQLLQEEEKELLVTEAQVLRERARRKEKEAMKKGMR